MSKSVEEIIDIIKNNGIKMIDFKAFLFIVDHLFDE